jgi:secreted trypsin-like serine protease
MKQLFVISLLVTATLANFVNIEPSIVGGSEARPHQYPFMVSIQWQIGQTMSRNYEVLETSEGAFSV